MEVQATAKGERSGVPIMPNKPRRRPVPFLLQGKALGDAIHRWLGISPTRRDPKWWTKSVAQRVLRSDYAFRDTDTVMAFLLRHLEQRWKNRDPEGNVSGLNWRWEPRLDLDTKTTRNASPEVIFERIFMQSVSREPDRCRWANMIPTASGVFSKTGGRRASIDLASRDGRKATFFELKWRSNNPLFAALELVGYAAMWLLSHDHAGRLGYVDDTGIRPALDFHHTRWAVLAPRDFYAGFHVQRLQAELRSSLSSLFERKGTKLRATFVFEQLGIDTNDIAVEELRKPATVRAIMDDRRPVAG